MRSVHDRLRFRPWRDLPPDGRCNLGRPLKITPMEPKQAAHLVLRPSNIGEDILEMLVCWSLNVFVALWGSTSKLCFEARGEASD